MICYSLMRYYNFAVAFTSLILYSLQIWCFQNSNAIAALFFNNEELHLVTPLFKNPGSDFIIY